MSEKPKPGDKVRATEVVEGILKAGAPGVQYVETEGGTILYTKIGGEDRATVEVIERADDPSKDPIGTVRQAPGVMKTVVVRAHDSNDEPWVRVTQTGGLRWRESARLVHWPIIGAVPGTPAWDKQQADPATQLYTGGELRERISEAVEAEKENQAELAAMGAPADRPLWTGDGSEEPPENVRQVADRDGALLTRCGEDPSLWIGAGGVTEYVADAAPWKVHLEFAWRKFGPFAEVRGD